MPVSIPNGPAGAGVLPHSDPEIRVTPYGNNALRPTTAVVTFALSCNVIARRELRRGLEVASTGSPRGNRRNSRSRKANPADAKNDFQDGPSSRGPNGLFYRSGTARGPCLRGGVRRRWESRKVQSLAFTSLLAVTSPLRVWPRRRSGWLSIPESRERRAAC